jgi:hypothetical protein
MGRTSLLMVIAFNVIFMALGFRMSSITSSAYNKYINYNCLEQTGLAAESGANIAISNAFFSPSTPISTTPFSSGTGVAGTIQLTKTSVPTNPGGIDTAGFDITSIAKDIDDTVITKIRVQGTSFATYVMFTTSEGGINWTTGDTCYGNYHTQDWINVNGNPDFKGLTTTFKGLKKNQPSNNPNFEGGYTAGVNLPLSGDFKNLNYLGTSIATGGAGGTSYPNNINVYIEFMPSGAVTVRTTLVGSATDGWSQSGTGNTYGSGATAIKACSTYASIDALTSTGVLLATGGDLHVKGQLNGKITLGNTGTGDVYIDSSVTYLHTPPTAKNNLPLSDPYDLLAIVANNDIHVADDADNNQVIGGVPKGVEIDASMYSLNGGFGADNYNNRSISGTNHYSGILKVIGGIQQSARNPVGASGGTPVLGFLKDYEYNNNLQIVSPKGYPTTVFAIQWWTDSTLVHTSFWNE